jgi:hypothetical protein
MAEGESTGTENEGASASGNVDAGSDGSGGGEAKPGSDPPTSTVGSGRDDTVVKPADDQKEEEKKPEPVIGTPKFKPSLAIPVFRIPAPEEFTATGWPDASAFFSTVEVPLTFEGFLNAFAQPEPEPTPGPAFRGQQEAPVIDVTGGAGGGGGGVEAAAAGGSPPVFRVPVVVAPAVPIPGRVAPTTPVGGPAAGAPPPPVAGAPTAVAGANAPTVRGSLSPKAETAKTEMTPMSGQATRLGYPRSLPNPTVGQLAVVALPGVGALMFVTFSGGVIGYRQANSLRFLRTAGAERFLP